MSQAPVPTALARWGVALVALPCRRCGEPIAPGAAFRRMTKQDWPYCAGCVLNVLGEAPPVTLPTRPAVMPKVTMPETLTRFAPPQGLDAWRRASGERE